MNKHETTIDPVFEEYLRDQLNQAVSDIDSVTAASLASARRRALEALAERQPQSWWSTISQPVWVGAAAAMLLAVVAVMMGQNGLHDMQGDTQWVKAVPLEANEVEMLLVIEQDQELVEDLEFYAWLTEIDIAVTNVGEFG